MRSILSLNDVRYKNELSVLRVRKGVEILKQKDRERSKRIAGTDCHLGVVMVVNFSSMDCGGLAGSRNRIWGKLYCRGLTSRDFQ